MRRVTSAADSLAEAGSPARAVAAATATSAAGRTRGTTMERLYMVSILPVGKLATGGGGKPASVAAAKLIPGGFYPTGEGRFRRFATIKKEYHNGPVRRRKSGWHGH